MRWFAKFLRPLLPVLCAFGRLHNAVILCRRQFWLPKSWNVGTWLPEVLSADAVSLMVAAVGNFSAVYCAFVL